MIQGEQDGGRDPPDAATDRADVVMIHEEQTADQQTDLEAGPGDPAQVGDRPQGSPLLPPHAARSTRMASEMMRLSCTEPPRKDWG